MAWFRIEAPHFVAGGELEPAAQIDHYTVTRVAPIIRYMMGWALFEVGDYCRRKGWRLVMDRN